MTCGDARWRVMTRDDARCPEELEPVPSRRVVIRVESWLAWIASLSCKRGVTAEELESVMTCGDV